MKQKAPQSLLHKHDGRIAFLYLAPTFAVFIVFKYYPLIYNFFLSLTSWNFFSPTKDFVGFTNYLLIFKSATFWKVLGQTLFYTWWSTAFSLVLGFFLAVALFGRKGFFPNLLKTLFFVPNITTASAVALLWVWIFDPEAGLAGQLFRLFGHESPRWLLTPEYAMWIIISLSVWRSMGYVMLIYHSGMSGISRDLYEAASIDGANAWQKITKITLPLLKPTTLFLVITSFISAMQVFDIVSVMTGGGPYGSTMVMNLYIYQTAFMKAKAGYASALSTILFLLVLGITLLQRKLSSEQDT